MYHAKLVAPLSSLYFQSSAGPRQAQSAVCSLQSAVDSLHYTLKYALLHDLGRNRNRIQSIVHSPLSKVYSIQHTGDSTSIRQP